MPTSHLAECSSIAATDPERARRLTANLAPLPPSTITIAPAPGVAEASSQKPPRPLRAGYRKNSIYERPGAIEWRILDRNQRAKLWIIAQGMERASKDKGARGGCLGAIGLAVFNALLYAYLNTGTGRCDPSYDSLRTRCALCKASITKAIDALEASGLLVVYRRMMRFRDERGVMVTRQISNAYVIADPSAVSIPEHVVARTPGRPFPSRKYSPLTRALTGLFNSMTKKKMPRAALRHPLAPRYMTVQTPSLPSRR